MPDVKTKDFVDQCLMPYVNAIETIDGNGNKQVTGVPQGWMKWEFDKCQKWNETHPGNMIAINLSKTNVMVIDIDDPKSVESTLVAYGECWQTKSSRRGLPHLYRLRHPEDPCRDEIDRDGTGVDYLYKQIWEDPDGFITIPAGEIVPPAFEAFTPAVAKAAKVKSDVPKSNTPEDVKFKMLMLDNIAVEHWVNRESWKRLLYAMRSEEISDELMEQYSRKANNYEDGCVQDLLKDWDEDKSTSWGTVEHFSRLSNSEAHAAICANRPRSVSTTSPLSNSKHEISTDKFLALKALELTDGEIVNIGDADGENKVLFVYDSKLGLWNMDRRGGNTRVRISDLLDDWLIEELESLKGMSDAAKPYNKAREKVNSNSGINNIYSIFKDTAPVNSGIEFNNTKPKYFTWSCGKTYDFESKQFVRLKKEDYVSMTTGYPYVTPKEEDVVSLEKLYRQILYEEDIYIPYMSLCATACIGTLLEKIVICTGKGGNGKGVVNELLAKMLGHYFYKGTVATLLEPIKDGGANPAIANMHNKRQTTFTEPDAGKKLNQATVKTLTGDNLINARQLYSGNMSVQNQSSIIMECNELPMISGKMDDSIKRRIVTIPFKVRYTDDLKDEELVAETPHVHPANLMYKLPAWQISMRSAVFEMIRKFTVGHGTELIVTPQCKAFADKYVMSSDFAMIWFKSTYERVDIDEHAEPIKMKTLFQRFKESDEYLTLDRDDKKYWTKSRLQDHVAKKLVKTDYIDLVYEGTTKHRNCIWNWRESLDV